MSGSEFRGSNPRGLTRPESVELELDSYGSVVSLEAGSWFVCFVPGLERQWWHRFIHQRHQHVFALRPEPGGRWTVFEPWWRRLLTANIDEVQVRKFLAWGARGDVLLVQETIPGVGHQLRGWMNCAVLSSFLLGRRYWIFTPHGLYRRLVREPNVCRVDVSALLEGDLAGLAVEDSRVVSACEACTAGAPRPPGAAKPFCMHCGRDLEVAAGKGTTDMKGASGNGRSDSSEY